MFRPFCLVSHQLFRDWRDGQNQNEKNSAAERGDAAAVALFLFYKIRMDGLEFKAVCHKSLYYI